MASSLQLHLSSPTANSCPNSRNVAGRKLSPLPKVQKMRAFASGKRRFPVVFRPLLWLLLVIACLTYPDPVPAVGPLFGAVDSLNVPAVPADFTATFSPRTQAKDHLPAPVPAGPPTHIAFPCPEKTFEAPTLTSAVHLPPSATVAPPSLPRPPPCSPIRPQ